MAKMDMSPEARKIRLGIIVGMLNEDPRLREQVKFFLPVH
jgi:hypothetical protein